MPAFHLHFPRLSLPALVAVFSFLVLHSAAQAQRPGGTPSIAYYEGIERLYEGDYRDAQRIFRNEARSAIKIGVTGRWVDSIAYHAMWGEVLYQQGQPRLALEQFNTALSLFLEHPKWLLKVNFKQAPRPDTNRARRPIPWGKSGRTFTHASLPTQMLVSQGDLLSGNRAAQKGGVVQSLQLWKVDVIEIIRTTTLAIRRRNELLGPLAKHDDISRELVAALTGAAPPNHWSKAWVDLQIGVAYLGEGKVDLARKRLARAERLAGQFDHPLTCVAMLEQGRLEMEVGNFDAALRHLAEAGFSAFYFENTGIIDESFRLRAVIRQITTQDKIDPALEPAAAWAKRKRFLHLYSRLLFAMCEELINAGNWDDAANALKTGQSRMRDARNGLLGNWSQYLEARLLYQQGNDSAPGVLAQAVNRQIDIAPRNLQIDISNRRYVQQRLRPRSAVDVYKALLSDPTPADWVIRPLQTLAYMKTPQDAAFDHWIDAQLASKAFGAALEVTDLAKRRRYHSQLAHGGKLASLRDTLEAPEATLIPRQKNQRSDLLLRYPDYANLTQQGKQYRSKIESDWRPGLDKQAQRTLAKVWKDWSASLQQRENFLQRISLERTNIDLQYPPLLASTDLQALLQPGQAIAIFHDTPQGLLGFLITADASSQWNCGPMARLAGPLNNFLRELGNYDANHSLTSDQLTSDKWLITGNYLFHALFDGSSIDPSALTELVVVPDGILWYAPFTAMPVELEDRTTPLSSVARVRIVPTMSLACGKTIPWRRIQRSALVGQEIVPGENDQQQADAREILREAFTNPIEIPTPSPIETSQLGALLDTLTVLDEIDINPAQPLTWSPLPQGRSKRQAGLNQWLALPQFGPQRIILPGVHTIAERGGKGSKRKNSTARPGEELFLASCGLISTGAQTVLLSRWRVGGQSTLEIMREFIQELPHTTAADSWQRTIQLAQELPIDPELEPRIKSSSDDPPLYASHPFFWAGYLLVDLGPPLQDMHEIDAQNADDKTDLAASADPPPDRPQPPAIPAKP